MSVLQAIRELFLGGGTGRATHRLALFDAHGAITHVVSQMDVIRHVAVHARVALRSQGSGASHCSRSEPTLRPSSRCRRS